jgi:hypothetical protein
MCALVSLLHPAMKTVNPFFLTDLIGALAGLGDNDQLVFEYSSMDPNDEEAVRSVVRALIVPEAREMSDRRRERVRTAYQYYLTKGDIDFNRKFESILPPFDPPDDARQFFMRTWEECFPGEQYRIFKCRRVCRGQ